MTATRKEKEEVKNKISEIVKKSPAVIFVNFHGLPVAETSEMRRGLRDKNVGYFVAKKTITKIALNEAGFKGELPSLDGELALAYSTETQEDSITPAREIYGFQKKTPDNISILGGIFEGEYMSKDKMTELASIPSLQVLYGQFVNVVNSPIQGLVVSLDQIAQSK